MGVHEGHVRQKVNGFRMETMEYSQIGLLDGTGAMVTSGQTATVHYTGWLYVEDAPEHKGAQFDSSVGRGPFSFRVGAG